MANLANGRHVKRVKLVYPSRVYGNADPPGLRVYAEGAFEEMVDPLGDIDVKTRVGPLEFNLLQRHIFVL